LKICSQLSNGRTLGELTIVLLIFKNFCPLTLWARKYSNSTRDNFDIYITNWLAKYNKIIYTSILGVVILILSAVEGLASF
jgi:hypothetical protein